jgi:acid phosphatase type 7
MGYLSKHAVKLRFRALLLLSALAAVAAFGSVKCTGNLEQFAARGSGDLTHETRRRSAPDLQHVAQCGDGTIESSAMGTLRRLPYLQRVTAERASIVFTASASQLFVVDLSVPNGQHVISRTATLDPSVSPTRRQFIADFEGLQPNTLYCYSIRGVTATAGFVTAPSAGSGKPVRFLAFGDSGTGTPSQYALADQMSTVAFDLILHTGDIAYNSGTLRQLERFFFQAYAPLLRSFPAFPVTGNHDYRTDDAGPYREVFVLPENGGEAGKERWFSFDWGDVHFVGLDTERTGKLQAEWLERDLQANQLPWVVVYAHRPPHSTGKHGPDAQFRKHFVPVLERHRVQLVLSGHEHHYERFKPINGVTYIITGGGGRRLRELSPSPQTAYGEAVLHFVYAEVEGETMLVHAVDAVGRQFDSTKIQR